MTKEKEIDDLRQEIIRLKEENNELHKQVGFGINNKTVVVPDQFAKVFAIAEKHVNEYFSQIEKSPNRAEILISGERYILIRSAALSYEFMDVFTEFYRNHPQEEARRIGNNFLFDIAHVLGGKDALAFHKKMKMTDPVQKLSAGPVHFSYTGWANVEIHPDSQPLPNENFYMKYIHHNSFEAQSWIKAGRKSSVPVCTMNSGYSSGWCEHSFGMPLTAVEIECEAAGGGACVFIMAPPHKIQDYLNQEQGTRSQDEHAVPIFFERKYNEDKLNESLKQKDVLLREVHHRVKNNLQVISSLLSLQKMELEDKELKRELDLSISRVNTMARVQDMIYGEKNVSSLNIEKYFSKLIRSLYALFGDGNSKIDFDVSIKVQKVNLNPDIAIPLGLIINEIATNSFKHAFKKGGKFYLNLTQEKDGKHILKVGDNGGGMKVQKESGTLGMSLISILCEQIDAEMRMTNSSKGLEYQIAFKSD